MPLTRSDFRKIIQSAWPVSSAVVIQEKNQCWPPIVAVSANLVNENIRSRHSTNALCTVITHSEGLGQFHWQLQVYLKCNKIFVL